MLKVFSFKMGLWFQHPSFLRTDWNWKIWETLKYCTVLPILTGYIVLLDWPQDGKEHQHASWYDSCCRSWWHRWDSVRTEEHNAPVQRKPYIQSHSQLLDTTFYFCLVPPLKNKNTLKNRNFHQTLLSTLNITHLTLFVNCLVTKHVVKK